ncbi:MAG: hypothetical protein ABIG88_01455 [Patescibacteria group bacterium]|nr:hypothetical protein [Patescibacteria group bacterium]
MMKYLIFLFPFGVALMVRLEYKNFQVWISLGIMYFFYLFLNWIFEIYPFKKMIVSLTVALSLGFIAPEIWKGLKNFIDFFLNRPQNISYILIGGGVIYLLYNPGLLGALISLVIMILGLIIIIKPFSKKVKK